MRSTAQRSVNASIGEAAIGRIAAERTATGITMVCISHSVFRVQHNHSVAYPPILLIGFDGRLIDEITIDDMIFAYETALHVVQRNEEKIFEEIARTVSRWVNNANQKAVLIMVELSRPPTPDGDFGWTLEEEDNGGSSDGDGARAREGELGEGERKETEDAGSLTVKERQVDFEDTQEVGSKLPHVADVSAWVLFAGETSLKVNLPFRYDFCLRRPVAKD